jgi:hypothetical protein
VLSFRRAHGVVGRALALVVVGVGIYAMFTTFSRIVYGALFVSMAVLGVASLRRPAAHRPADRPRRHPAVLAALAAVVLAGGMLTFPEGGYRALLAFTGLALLAWPAGAALAGMRVGGFVLGLVGGLVLAAGCAAAALALPKGVYLAYAGLWALAALLVVLRGRGLRVGGAVVLALLVGLALATVLISAFWSEPTRFMGSLGGALLVIAVLARQALGRTPCGSRACRICRACWSCWWPAAWWSPPLAVITWAPGFPTPASTPAPASSTPLAASGWWMGRSMRWSGWVWGVIPRRISGRWPTPPRRARWRSSTTPTAVRCGSPDHARA